MLMSGIRSKWDVNLNIADKVSAKHEGETEMTMNTNKFFKVLAWLVLIAVVLYVGWLIWPAKVTIPPTKGVTADFTKGILPIVKIEDGNTEVEKESDVDVDGEKLMCMPEDGIEDANVNAGAVAKVDAQPVSKPDGDGDVEHPPYDDGVPGDGGKMATNTNTNILYIQPPDPQQTVSAQQPCCTDGCVEAVIGRLKQTKVSALLERGLTTEEELRQAAKIACACKN